MLLFMHMDPLFNFIKIKFKYKNICFNEFYVLLRMGIVAYSIKAYSII